MRKSDEIHFNRSLSRRRRRRRRRSSSVLIACIHWKNQNFASSHGILNVSHARPIHTSRARSRTLPYVTIVEFMIQFQFIIISCARDSLFVFGCAENVMTATESFDRCNNVRCLSAPLNRCRQSPTNMGRKMFGNAQADTVDAGDLIFLGSDQNLHFVFFYPLCFLFLLFFFHCGGCFCTRTSNVITTLGRTRYTRTHTPAQSECLHHRVRSYLSLSLGRNYYLIIQLFNTWNLVKRNKISSVWKWRGTYHHI